MYDVVVVGAGITGTFIARELSKYDLKIAILEKGNDISEGTTKANSAIIHAGYDAKPNTNKAKYNIEGNKIFNKACEELSVHLKRIGSLVIAFNDEEIKTLEYLLKNGTDGGIEGLEIWDGKKVHSEEPNLNKNIKAALFAPTCGIVSPFELAIALTENAVVNGTDLLLNSEVVSIKKVNDYFEIKCANEKIIETKYVINAAGVYADKISEMIGAEKFKIIPRRGEYYLLDKTVGDMFKYVIFQCPTEAGKGVLVSPTVHGNLIIGPNAENIDDKEDVATTSEAMTYIFEASRKTSDKIPFSKTITTFSGLRPKSDRGDFIIENSKKVNGFINVAGIESPGLASSPAIANRVVEIVKEVAGPLKEKKDFNPYRKQTRFMELSNEEKAKLIKKDPSFGRIICRCENITEGEILESIRRPVGATTMDGIKKRVRPGSGRCQGGFCGPIIMKILAKELKVDMKNIKKSSLESEILTGHTKE